MKPTVIFVGSKAAYGRFQREYALVSESIRHVSEVSQLRGMGEVTVLHDRREVSKDEKWHRLLVCALEHNAYYDPNYVDAANKQAAAYDARYSPYRGLQGARGYSKGQHPQQPQPSQQVFGYNISTNSTPPQYTSTIWLDPKMLGNSNAITISKAANTGATGPLPGGKALHWMVDEVVEMKPPPEPKSCMWCAAEFQTDEELDLHENGCDG